MTIKDFIRKHRDEIDTIVYNYYKVEIGNDTQRHEWLLNDEGLYRWAHREGVNI
jgi:hypothetical protein